MKLCLFKDIGDGRIECDSCGRNLIGDASSTAANCKGPDRYKAAKELFGLSPACNCNKRKEWLNSVSDWWMGEKDA